MMEFLSQYWVLILFAAFVSVLVYFGGKRREQELKQNRDNH